MAVEERSRRTLYDLLKEPLGMAATNALLDELPPVGSALATRDDVNLLRTELHTEVAGLRAELRSEVAGVRAEIAVMRAEVDASIAGLGRQIAELGAMLSKQQVRLFLGMLGFVVALVVGLNGPWAH